MSDLYTILKKALSEGRKIERTTDTSSGDENLIIDGMLAYGSAIENGCTESIIAEPTLVMFGAGHVSKALYDLVVLQGMRTKNGSLFLKGTSDHSRSFCGKNMMFHLLTS